MFNPLKLNPIEKRMLLGGLTNSIVYYSNMYASDAIPYPPELNARLEPHLPRNADIIGDLAPPAALFIAKKIVKSTTKKEKIGDMFFGSLLYAGPNLIHDTVVQAAYQVGADTRPAATARFPAVASAMSRYTVNSTGNNRPVAASSLSKYVVTG